MQSLLKDLQLIIYQYSQEHKQERLNKEYHTNYRWSDAGNRFDGFDCLLAFGYVGFNYRNLRLQRYSNSNGEIEIRKIWSWQDRKWVANLPKHYVDCKTSQK